MPKEVREGDPHGEGENLGEGVAEARLQHVRQDLRHDADCGLQTGVQLPPLQGLPSGMRLATHIFKKLKNLLLPIKPKSNLDLILIQSR